MTKPHWDRWYKLARWKKLRLEHLTKEPWCCYCDRKLTPATVVDHIEPHKGDEALFWSPDNLQSLCKTHHDATKQRTERRGYSTACDINGWPTDPRHPANR